MKNILTIDVEDWFHICGVRHLIPEDSWPRLESRVRSNTLRILDILARRSVKASFFILGFVAETCPDLVKEIQREGHEIATHGHAHKRVYTMTPPAFRRDLRKAVGVISAITGEQVKGYRAPEWSIRDDSLWALDILSGEGFEYDSSMAPVLVIGNQGYSRVPYRLTTGNGKLWEFPPLVCTTRLVNLPIGGGWGLRVFPYRLIRSSIAGLNRRGQPATIYFHPSEFDPAVPRIKLPPAKRFVLSARIETAEKRLDRLLKDFSFTCASQILENKTIRG